MINKSFEFKIGVIGLGYVGTPLACLFSKKYDTWGYDIKAEKVAKLAKSTMKTTDLYQSFGTGTGTDQ